MLLDHPSLALFSNVFAPDEHYFMNALVHLKGASLDQFVNRCAHDDRRRATSGL